MGCINLLALKCWWFNLTIDQRHQVEQLIPRYMPTIRYSCSISAWEPDEYVLLYALKDSVVMTKTNERWLHLKPATSCKFSRIVSSPKRLNVRNPDPLDPGALTYRQIQAEELWLTVFKPLQLQYYPVPLDSVLQAVVLVDMQATLFPMLDHDERHVLGCLSRCPHNHKLADHVYSDAKETTVEKYIGHCLTPGKDTYDNNTQFEQLCTLHQDIIETMFNKLLLFQTFGLMNDNIMQAEREDIF